MNPIEPTLLDQIKSLHWYQSIPISDDYSTPGETGNAEQWKLEKMQLPVSLEGKSVLDIGCNEGFFSFEAERRGANRVVAIDKSSEARTKFELIRKIRGSNVEFRAVDLHSLSASRDGKFEIVLFLSVFHHLRYPFEALDKVAELTEDFAFLEFVEAVSNTNPELSALVRKMSKKGHLHMLPTRNFTLEIVERAGFERVEVIGTHRAHELNESRKMPGFSEQRTLYRAFRRH